MSELVLHTGLVQENCVGTDVEDTIVTLIYYKDEEMSKVRTDLVF